MDMTIDEKYMYRCLQLAAKGRGNVSPNPMVGAVIVHNGSIIGEGYHRCFGQAHAEVNAINSVQNKELLKYSVIYVSLEPCSHYGKTPPCAELIIKYKIPKVVISCLDPFPEVSGNGVKMLQNAGIDVVVGVLEKQSQELNKEFICLHTNRRPYVYLKWAQSSNYCIAHKDGDGKLKPAKISNPITSILVHKKRADIDSIMIGTNTAIIDNPHLTTRLLKGKNPLRIVLDREGKIPQESNVFDSSAKTIVFTEQNGSTQNNELRTFIKIKFDDNLLQNILNHLGKLKISSLMVEGGSSLLQSFINQKLWDEAIIETSNDKIEKGYASPKILGTIIKKQIWSNSTIVRIEPS